LTPVAFSLPKHADEHGPKRPILLAVEGAALGAPVLSDPLGALEVGEHQDVQKLGAGSGTQGVYHPPGPSPTGHDNASPLTEQLTSSPVSPPEVTTSVGESRTYLPGGRMSFRIVDFMRSR
jgi:hypothetical protein